MVPNLCEQVSWAGLAVLVASESRSNQLQDSHPPKFKKKTIASDRI